MQDRPTDGMVFDPAQLVSYASERVDLPPGDVVFLRSPPGSGKHHGRLLPDGDVIDSQITDLGRQGNRCTAEDLQGLEPRVGHWTNT
ncbi:hypothetical protein GB931_00330 [Modestobacter sp. I12A-02628]|uniref:Fumarylacetoacetate hydrolase family protein n=1 Tax=Goekera deserti TaxID=2497753 RepID=A0A7K3WI42_9ACTN|nr:hypothetical protein [Goekera deserti]NDI47294.1 hypothetical protein [Goekera deserti]NEL56124.1 fumarylacetoacetate hydrolase family protein [Goekera deserti]